MWKLNENINHRLNPLSCFFYRQKMWLIQSCGQHRISLNLFAVAYSRHFSQIDYNWHYDWATLWVKNYTFKPGMIFVKKIILLQCICKLFYTITLYAVNYVHIFERNKCARKECILWLCINLQFNCWKNIHSWHNVTYHIYQLRNVWVIQYDTRQNWC